METLNRALEGQLQVNKAAVVLGASDRHARRILAAYRREGAAAVARGAEAVDQTGDLIEGELRASWSSLPSESQMGTGPSVQRS